MSKTEENNISEIIIFRNEEWFKVFVHETFHLFGVDFSNMSNLKKSKDIFTFSANF